MSQLIDCGYFYGANRRSPLVCARGFSLLETLVVVAIIALLTGVAMTRFRYDSAERQLLTTSKAFGQLYQSLQEEALFSGKPVRMQWHAGKIATQKRTDLVWEPYKSAIAQRLNANQSVRWQRGNPDAFVYFWPSGETSPFTLTMRLGDYTQAIEGDAMGKIELSAIKTQGVAQ